MGLGLPALGAAEKGSVSPGVLATYVMLTSKVVFPPMWWRLGWPGQHPLDASHVAGPWEVTVSSPVGSARSGGRPEGSRLWHMLLFVRQGALGREEARTSIRRASVGRPLSWWLAAL